MMPPEDTAPSQEFLTVFRAEANSSGRMSFARFMELALYHPQVGYYRRDQPRVGYAAGTDFFTASTSGPIFGELVAAACVKLLEGHNPRDYTFVEIGAEPPAVSSAERFDPARGRTDGGIMAGVTHPFGAVHTLRVGDPIELAGRCVVFSNELFDAQPFHRFVFRRGAWREFGVTLQTGRLIEIELVEPTAAPPSGVAPEGYVFDAPLAAEKFAEVIAARRWTGLFVACDYGKSLRELMESCPAGTARAYHRHAQFNDLLARPGQQDITCHICWDWLGEALSRHGFITPTVESQEAFFIHHAAEVIAATSAAEAARFSQKKLALMQLLHPSHLGQKFQVLHAWRG
jgi:SAM-dependent MidA family methyltransferase